ncbi:MAG: MaoC family dehydratase [Alphaproteobacteria bacterium]|nr:MaoC family dehydratase [Alphaproteobacteria bacterium]MBV9695082.1 MaoC family dehydratase [Alphaproteobacteria bacterium]
MTRGFELTKISKSSRGNFFEDFRLGQRFVHLPARTLSDGDAALYKAIYGGRFALQSSAPLARALGFETTPFDNLLVFHMVFGMSVSDISLNAIANLGYAQIRFGKPLYPGATLSAFSEVVGLKENSDGKTGIVYVRTEGLDAMEDEVISLIRWVMVRKRGADAGAQATVPQFEAVVAPATLVAPATADLKAVPRETGSASGWDDYAIGERIDHIDGTTVEEAEHAMATRLYHNTARVHFNQFAEKQGRFGKRIVYGGHVISMARALSYNGLANAWLIAAINGGRHVNPVFAGDTIYAWSEVLDKAAVPKTAGAFLDRKDCGALRLRLVATKDLPCTEFPGASGAPYPPQLVLDLDYWAILPRR